MSITSILYGNTFDSLKDYIKMNAPKKDAFLSSTGYPAFSTSIPIQVVGSTHSTHETALVGEIADYAFCLEILRYVKKNRIVNYNNFFRFIGSAYKYIVESDPEHSEIIKKLYSKLVSDCSHCVITGAALEIEQEVEYSYKLHQIENFHRVPHEHRDVFWDNFTHPCLEQVVSDVIQLIELFRKCFFETGIIKEKSTIVLHPRLGTRTSPVGIADLYCDGVFYDFKASNMNGYSWKDVGQVYGYYILQKLSLKYSKEIVLSEPVPIKKVDKIALYYSRYGDIETCDLKSCNAVLYSKKLVHLAKMMDQHSRELHCKHIENMKYIFAPNEWNKLASLRETTKPGYFTPENIGYTVGDAVYHPALGKGQVHEFLNIDDCWYVVLSLESGRTVKGDIYKFVLLNWRDLDNHKYLLDDTKYFL